MAQTVNQVFYVSEAGGGIGKADVDDIVRASIARNERLSVTGQLVFSGGHFAQLLEGSRSAIDELMASIRRDPRHARLRVLMHEDASARAFGGWSMSYVHGLGMCDLLEELLEAGTMPAERASRAMRLVFRPSAASER